MVDCYGSHDVSEHSAFKIFVSITPYFETIMLI